MAVDRARLSPKQSWADLSDDEDEFRSESSDSKGHNADIASCTTGSPHMSWANASDDGSWSDWDANHHNEEDAPFKVTRNTSGGWTKASKHNARDWNQQPTQWHQQWHGSYGQWRQPRKGGKNRSGRMPQSPQGPTQSRSQGAACGPPSPSQSSQRHFADVTAQMWNGQSFHQSSADLDDDFDPDLVVQPFSVQVEGMPSQLCNDCCLDAIIQQSGLQDFVLECRIDEGKGGKSGGLATIKLANWQSAMQCYNHFTKQSWNLGKSVKVRWAPNASQISQIPQHMPLNNGARGFGGDYAFCDAQIHDPMGLSQAANLWGTYQGEALDFNLVPCGFANPSACQLPAAGGNSVQIQS